VARIPYILHMRACVLVSKTALKEILEPGRTGDRVSGYAGTCGCFLCYSFTFLLPLESRFLADLETRAAVFFIFALARLRLAGILIPP
jgi:hypothetical protein